MGTSTDNTATATTVEIRRRDIETILCDADSLGKSNQAWDLVVDSIPYLCRDRTSSAKSWVVG